MSTDNTNLFGPFSKNGTETVCVGISNYQAGGLVFVRVSPRGEAMP